MNISDEETTNQIVAGYQYNDSFYHVIFVPSVYTIDPSANTTVVFVCVLGALP